MTRRFRAAVFVTFLVFHAVELVSAQVSVTSGISANTPVDVVPGGPVGAFALEDLDKINLFNGALSTRIPLLSVGGRGQSGYPMSLSIYRRWYIETNIDIYSMFTSYKARTNLHGSAHWWAPGPPVYSPGAIIGRRVAVGEDFCGSVGPTPIMHTDILTRLTFISSDGSESELVDAETDGASKSPSACVGYSPGPGFDRKKVFRSKNGEAMTFVSDTNIVDHSAFHYTEYTFNATGWLYFKDGRRYRVHDGKVTEIRDRHGNRTLITYDSPGNRVIQIVDPTKRVISITYVGVTHHVITYMGDDGSARTIKVNFRLLSESDPNTGQSVLDSGFSTQSYDALFGTYGGDANHFVPRVVSSIELPHGKYYAFRYNSYGEVTESRLPTGGKVRFEHGGGGVSGASVVGVTPQYLQVYRRVTKREVYPDGSNREGYTEYANTEEATPGTVTSHGIYSNSIITVTHRNDAGTILGREKHWFYGGPRDYRNATTEYFRYAKWRDGQKFKSEVLDVPSGEVLLSRVEDTIEQRTCESGEVCRYSAVDCVQGTCKFAANDPRVKAQQSLLPSGGGVSSQVSKVEFLYDKYNNVTRKDEHAFGSSSPGPVARRTSISYMTGGYDTAGTDVLQTTHIRNLPSRVYLYEGTSSLVSDTIYFYDESTPTARSNPTNYTAPHGATKRGNLTRTQRWVSGSTWVTEQATYDVLGNVVQVTDGRGNPTSFEYTDDFTTPAPSLGGDSTWAYLTKISNPASHHNCYKYNYHLGQPTSLREESNSGCTSGVVTTAAYNDSLGRLTRTNWAFGTAHESRTLHVYNDAPVNPFRTTYQDKDNLNDGAIITATIYDGLGRVNEDRLYEGDGSNYITTVTQYDGRGRPWRKSNPYRPASESLLWTTSTYDALNRPRQTTYPDDSVTTLNYAANRTESIDQASKRTYRFADALGRLTQVVEAPTADNLSTSYSYTAHDKIRTVCQDGTLSESGLDCSGGQTRTYTYDALGRLLTANNPETGTVTYSLYDGNGNLGRKTDARGWQTNYAYDNLNRPTSKTYTDANTPSVIWVWDTQKIGRLTSVESGISKTSFTYDTAARILTSTQRTDNVDYSFQYRYDRTSGLNQVQYPSQRWVRYSTDAANRLVTVQRLNSTEQLDKTYWSGVQYAPQGVPKQITLGNSLTESWAFNAARQQPWEIKLSSSGNDGNRARLQYAYCSGDFSGGSCGANNGNVLGHWNYAPNRIQYFTYDALNRLSSVNEGGTGGWSETFGYDRYSNWYRADQTGLGTAHLMKPTSAAWFTINGVNKNRPVPPGQTESTYYDAAGNLIKYGALNVAYDAENRPRQVTGAGTVTYHYDGEGRRVKKVDGSVTTWYVYDASGELVAEYGGTTPAASATHYVTTDHLGSTRLVTDQTGAVVSRHDYLPFGEEINAGIGGRTTGQMYVANSTLTQRFTGKERDTETGLDYFLARYLSSPMGRFTSADAPFADQHASDPQSWNLYGYVRNNPLRYVDPTGRCSRDAQGGYWDRDDAGTYMFAGPCADGEITSEDDGLSVDDDVPLGAMGQVFAREMNRRAGASKQMIGTFAGASVVAGTGVGAFLQYSGTVGLTTLGNITPQNLVYQSVNIAGDVRYVGITSNFARREAQHAARFALQRIPGLQNLTRSEARAVEQVLIEKFGLAKNGGTLLNQINSIASSNPIYANSLRVGAQILKNVGYPGF